MSKFKPYPEYKDSGIEWVGDIPKGWKVVPLFSVMSERREPNIGLREKNLLSLSYGSIVNRDIDSLEGLLPASFETYQIIYPSDIIFRLTDLQNDKKSLRSAIAKEKGIITSAYLATICKTINAEYAQYLFRFYDLSKVFYSMGGGLRQSMRFADMKRLDLLLPSHNEQKQIALFLDHETVRMDELIAEQKRLIELLKDKRQAVISHAVTKGLDPNAPMKDSGIEWLGEVPEHWQIVKLSFKLNLKSGDFITSGAIDDKGRYPVYGGNGLRGFTDDFNRIGPRILIGRQGALCGNVHLVEGKFFSSEHALVVTPLDRFDLVFLSSFLKFMNLGQYSVSAAQPGISVDRINGLSIVVPPLAEQKNIGVELSRELLEIDALIQEAEKAIELMKERRSALISAAVTGKIDVRDWQPEKEQAEALAS